MKGRKSRIFTLHELPMDIFVAFGGGIGISVYADAFHFQYGNEMVEFENLRLSMLKNEFDPNTDLLDEPQEVKEDVLDSPYINLLFDNVDSVDVMITSLQTVREKILAKSKNGKEI